MPHGYVKEVARSDARWIVVIVFGARRGYRYPCGPELRWSAACQGRTERWENAAAEESCLQLLIRREARQVNRSGAIRGERDRACHQAAVIPPIEARPRTALAYLILKMGSRVEHFVMVDAERAQSTSGAAPAPPICGVKKRDATLEKTNSPVKPWKLGTLTRPAKPGILELCHSMGKVSGVLPKTPKS